MSDAPGTDSRDPDALDPAAASDPTGTGATAGEPAEDASEAEPAVGGEPIPISPAEAPPEAAAAEPPRPPADEKVMPLVDHLGELRRRVAISLLAVVIGAAVGFVFAPQIIELLISPLPNEEVVFLTLSGGFLVWMRISLVFGLLVALPVVLYQLWAFVAPGLTPDERRATLPWIPLSVVFFLLGTLVAWVTLPYAVSFLLGFQIEGTLEALPSAEAYFGFVTFIFVIFGLVMQFPIVLVFLSKLGILTVDQLKKARRYVLFGVVVFAVVITPGGDPISPIVLSGTMYVLYEITIFLLQRRQAQRVESEAAGFGGAGNA
jgi:sec-independent protein translocase protein TatC